MSECKYVDGEYLKPDKEPCKVDGYGDPTKHCTGRRTCSEHVGWGELTCARCIGRCRRDIQRITDLAPLMMTQALDVGVDSEAANLAGPATDVRGWAARRLAMNTHLLTWERLGRITGRQYHRARFNMEDDDDLHPHTVLTRWRMMLAEDYGHPLPDQLTMVGAGDYLDRTLGRMAQDDEQDFGLFAREMRTCRRHLEAVIRNSDAPERGAPCPDCAKVEVVLRMRRDYGHWCEDPDCERIHYPDDSGDEWVCPKGHKRSHADYVRWVEERTA